MSDADPPQSACPVDHKGREAWLSQARAASAAACPVDHGAREVWLQHAARASPSPSSSSSSAPPPPSSSWTSYLPRLSFFDRPRASPPPPRAPRSLATEREVSTIPRLGAEAAAAAPPAAPPPNRERDTGADPASGNWVYPSERMFFDAMKRKGHDPRAADMRAVVPIHNAVNERAWAEIKAWEEPWLRGSSCRGPRLRSFAGRSAHMSPRARLNTLLGYHAPFDRHDWVVDRCGTEVEYVIDFYAGRPTAAAAAAGAAATPDADPGKLSFYLDVRPKLNSWEGVKMRALRALGLT
ncbi:cytochrome c and c1 heme-lyase [Durotheca rogersii]|uniref:cytochrome c and c1 heme-lyase n=1 Tax=Durotheca rogersii TaxID=419775 RepID=UPI00221F04FE|nr:cytochrome c and c1 heme-lyase [Durotheca rogersii]KAI5863562.1 cytochrome c and c1 heme-lyase [Durotheca rogersii]